MDNMNFKLQLRKNDVALSQELFLIIKQIIKPDFQCIDVGANIGVVTLMIASQLDSGHVFAIEPQRGNYERLILHVEENELSDRVTPMLMGLSNKPGKLPIYKNRRNLGDYRLWKDSRIHGKNIKPIDYAEVITLDTLVKNIGVNIDFIKIDTQGMEGKILAGATSFLRELSGFALIEFWPYGIYSHKSKNYFSLVDEFCRLLFGAFDYVYCMKTFCELTESQLVSYRTWSSNDELDLLCVRNRPEFDIQKIRSAHNL